jgi:hypothetical protein
MAVLLNSNVAGNLNVTSNIVTNALQLVVPGSLTATVGSAGSNVGTIYMKNVANTILVYTSTSTSNNTNYNLDGALQPHMGYRDVFRVMPSSNGVANNVTCFFSDSMSINVQANAVLSLYPTNTSPIYKNSKTRIQLNANSTILGNANAVFYANQNVIWTGNGAGSGNGGGFLYIHTFTIDSFANTNTAFFAGISNVAFPLSVTANADPIANTVYDVFGVGCNSNTGNMQLIFGRAGSTRNITDMTNTFNLNTSDVYELTLYFQPAGASVGARVRNLSNGAEVSIITTSNTPRTNTFMFPTTYIQGNTSSTGTALSTLNAQFSIYRSYLEVLY